MLSDQAESSLPSFIAEVTQLTASSFYISRLDLDLA
jgi:hypothetical protein